MRRYEGRRARPRWAKKPRAPRDPNSTSHARQTEANDMSEGCVSTPSSANRPTRFG